MTLRKAALILAALLPAPSARAAEWVIKHSTYYITADQQLFPDFPPPPAHGSPEELADLKTSMDWQVKRSSEQCAAALAQRRATYQEFFGDISPFPDPLPPEADEILRRVRGETDGMLNDLKERFGRRRPFLTDPMLSPCLNREGGLSYPSGHATISRVFALMLADLVPARKAEFLARADQAALNRVIGGVHFLSDVEAGKRLAGVVYGRYKKSKAFAADMKTLRRLLKKKP